MLLNWFDGVCSYYVSTRETYLMDFALQKKFLILLYPSSLLSKGALDNKCHFVG